MQVILSFPITYVYVERTNILTEYILLDFIVEYNNGFRTFTMEK